MYVVVFVGTEMEGVKFVMQDAQFNFKHEDDIIEDIIDLCLISNYSPRETLEMFCTCVLPIYLIIQTLWQLKPHLSKLNIVLDSTSPAHLN